MNILILVRDYKSGLTNEKSGMPVKSGAEVHVEKHALAFKETGHKVTVMTKKRLFRTALRESIDGIDVCRLPSGFRNLICGLYLLCNRRKIDVLYIFGQPSFNLTALFLGSMLGLPSVYVSSMTGEAFETIKSDRYFPKGWQPFRRFHNYLLGKCSAYIAISTEIASEFIEHGFKPERITVMPQGVNLSRFYPLDSGSKQQCKRKLGLPSNKKIVLFCSRLDLRKGIDILFSSWPDIHRQAPNAHLLIVGGGSHENIAHLRQLIANDTAGTITYIGEVDNPAPYYQCADIFVFLSRREGLPNVLTEAMACGCACVASAIGGCIDVIHHDETGLLFGSGDTAELMALVVGLLNDEEKMNQLSTNAAQYCRQHIDLCQMANKRLQLFADLAGRKPSRAALD